MSSRNPYCLEGHCTNCRAVRRRKQWPALVVATSLALSIEHSACGATPAENVPVQFTGGDATLQNLRLPSRIALDPPSGSADSGRNQAAVSEPLPSMPGQSSNAPLTLSDLEQLALQNNPTLSAAAANVSAARGRQIQGGLSPNPSFGYFSDDVGENGTAGKQGAFVSQQFVTGGKLALNVAMGRQEVEEFRLRRNAQELRILSDVRMRFYDSLVAQRRVELSDELMKIAEQSQGISQRLLKAQQVSQNDSLQAEIEAQEAQILISNARNSKTEAWRRLAAIVGAPTFEERPIGGDLDHNIPTYEWEDTYSRLLADSPQLMAAQARSQRARIAIERAHRENVPNIDTFVSVSRRAETGDDLVGIQAGIPIPIFNRNQGNILQANADLIAAENDIRRIELDLKDRLGITFRRYANARQQVDRYQNEILPRAKKSIELVTRGYEAGQVDYLSLLTSQRTYVRVNLTYLDSLAELRQATTLIEGQLLSDSLQVESMSNSAEK